MTDNFFDQGVAAINLGDVAKAVVCFEKAVKVNPKDAETVACLGQSLIWSGKQSEGLLYLRKAGTFLLKKAKKSRDITDIIALAEQLQSCNDYQGSLKLVQQANQINQSDARVFQLLAQAYSRLNDNKNALLAGKRAVKILPNNSALNILLADFESKIGDKDKAIFRLEKVLKQSDVAPEDAHRAHKDLAVILDKQGDFKRAFMHLKAAEGLSKQLSDVIKQDVKLVPDLITANQKGFDKKLLNRWKSSDFVDEIPAPVFLIGFLRSGTTLVQEVLGVHADVFISDENEFIGNVAAEINRLSGVSGSLSEQLWALDIEGVKQLRQFYWQQVGNYYGKTIDKKVFVDKTTLNIINLGLINCLFPDAKIIFVLRDPRDVCLSCYMQQMLQTAMTVHLNEWQKMAEFYALVMRWWLYVKQEMTLDTVEIKYEDAVTDFDCSFKRVFEFLGLVWTDDVTAFHRHAGNKFIASPSYFQVSQPLFSSSIGRWQEYDEAFVSIENKLAFFVKTFGY